jgi:hypothetical protein
MANCNDLLSDSNGINSYCRYRIVRILVTVAYLFDDDDLVSFRRRGHWKNITVLCH